MTVVQKRVFWFFIATFAFSWIGIYGNQLWPSPAWQSPVSPYGPLLAALFIIPLLQGRDGFVNWWNVIKVFRAPSWVYVVALLYPLAFVAISFCAALLAGVETGPLPDRDWTRFLVLVPILLLNGPLQEQTTFRGHAQLELERELTPLTSSLLIGVGVLIWHLPIFILEDTLWLPIVLGIFGAAVISAWLLKAGGSVWPVVLAHLSVNYFGGGYVGRTMTDPEGRAIFYGTMGGCYVLVAALLAWRLGPSLHGGSAARRAVRPA